MSKHFSDSSQRGNNTRWDYGGLEVDTRAADNTDKHLDPQNVPKPKRHEEDNDIYLHEKEIHVEERERDPYSPSSTGSPIDGTLGGTTMTPESPCTPGKPCIHEAATGRPCLYTYSSDVKERPVVDTVPVAPPEPKPRKICGLRRRHFWTLFAIVVGIIIAAAIIGGAIAGTTKNTNPSTAAPPSTENPVAPATTAPTPSVTPAVDTPLLSQDVIADSPMNVISYTNPGAPNPTEKQTFRMYFQSVIGNVKEVISDAFKPWQTASPLFTDAVNNTGLATVTWLNLTDGQQSASIYYIDGKFNLQEKRKKFSDTLFWEQANLNSILRVTVRGTVSMPKDDDDDPKNDWDGYRLAAVYSRKFAAGPQTRLFYRQQDLNGSSWIQEAIWDQINDKWTTGASFNDSSPNSHFAASIDESTNILRLFYSTGGRTLQEYWTDITTPETRYAKGFKKENFLLYNNVDISTVSLNGTTFLYYYSVKDKSIKEMQITGKPGDVANQETLTTANVIVPASTSKSGKATYQPLAAAKTDVVGLDPSLMLFWVDNVVGINSTAKQEGGYGRINQIKRRRDDKGWSSKPEVVEIPLGNENAEPWHPE